MINHKFSRHYRDYREYVIRFMSTNPKNHKINTHDKNWPMLEVASKCIINQQNIKGRKVY